MFGVDFDGPVITENDNIAVEVPETANPLDPLVYNLLQHEIDPLASLEDDLVPMYETVEIAA